MSGSILKKRREELGLDITEVSVLLKIRKEYLSAIEEDLFDKLPAPVYTMGYIRSYAQHLNVDPTEIIKVYATQLPPPKTDTTIMPVILDEDRRRPKRFYMAAALLVVIAGIIVGLKVLHIPDRLRQGHTPKETPAVTPAPVTEKALSPVKGPVVQQPAMKPPEQPQAPQEKPVIPASGEQPLSKEAAPAAQASAQRKDLHRLTIVATDTSWVFVRFKNGKYQELTLQPGQTKEWFFLEGATLRTGNAGGIQISLDGKEVGPPGEKGQPLTLELQVN
ncbi:MAG: helix-turn-helix domain-containing protein [Nitrospirae bacterium]|nr:MAG: helix-turn-helix domain-containing protein [Nitrospirota bacterium]